MAKIRIEIDRSGENMAEEVFFSQVDPRRRQEIHDAYMVREDSRAMANLPRQAIHHEYDQDKFKHHSMSAGSPEWSHNEVGFIRRIRK